MAYAYSTAPTLPEMDDIDGYSFVGFEKFYEMDKYVRETTLFRRHYQQHYVTPPPPRLQSGHVAKKSGKIKTTTATLSNRELTKTGLNPSKKIKNTAKTTGGHQRPKKSALTRHKQRLRKSDKKAISEKIQGFLFVSAFSLQDLDNYEGEVGAATKRKAETAPPNATKKPRKKKTHGLKISECPEDGRSKQLLGVGPIIDLTIDEPMPPFKKFVVKRRKKLALKKSDTDGVTQPRSRKRSRKMPAGPALTAAMEAKHYQRMKIDDGLNRSETVTISSSSSESDSLDVCKIDDIPPTMQFTQNDTPKSKPDSKKQKSDIPRVAKSKSKKKKCRTCCAHPCKITEAKRVNSLWGCSFPSYNVSCVSTCKIHIPGEINVYPNETKFGCIDTCIQTTASDIEMHHNFAERFPHRAIAVESSGTIETDDDASMTKPASHLRVTTTKIEHHRTSEQKRREQLHESFVGLRKVICVSQTKFDNHRTSKQWILEESQKLIGSLESEATLLTVLKRSLVAKNQELKKTWTKLSGKKFDPDLTKEKTEDHSQSKLMSLYKKYRQDVHKEKPKENTPEVVPGEQIQKCPSGKESKVECSKVECSGHNSSKKKPKNKCNPNEPIVISEGEEDPVDKVENRLKKWSKVGQESLSKSPNNSSEVIVNQECRADTKPNVTVNQFTAAAITDKTCEFTSIVKHDQDITLAADKPPVRKACQAVSAMVKKPSDSTVDKPSQPHAGYMPIKAVVPIVKRPGPSHVIFSSPPVSNASPSPPPTSLINDLLTKPSPLIKPNTLKRPNILIKPRPLPLVMRVSGIDTRNPNAIASLRVVNKILTVNKAREVPLKHTGSSIVSLGKPRNVFVLNNQVDVGTPTQWTSLGNMIPSVFNMIPIEDIGAIVEVVDEKFDESNYGNTVLLDATENKSSVSEEEAHTFSLVPSLSSINVTLNSVGSITSNKIFNKKPAVNPGTQLDRKSALQFNKEPALSMHSTFPNILDQLISKTAPKTTSETSAQIRRLEGKIPICANMEVGVQEVPKISDALLSGIDSTNEQGLCIISNVFSLSDDKSGKSSSENQQEHTSNNFRAEQSSAEECEDSPPMHDHNYHKMNLQSNNITSV